MRELFVKIIPKFGAHAHTAHIGGAPPPPCNGTVKNTKTRDHTSKTETLI